MDMDMAMEAMKALQVVEEETWLEEGICFNVIIMDYGIEIKGKARPSGLTTEEKGKTKLTLAQEDQKKTTFITPWGCFCYRVLPFGLMNGCAWYQKRVNKVFPPILGKFVKDLIDEFCVYSTRKDHCSKLEVAFKKYDEGGSQLNPKKCYLAQPRVKFLGHMISKNGIEADPDKVKALILLPSPKDTKKLATFLQKVKYMSRFIPLSSQLLYPLQQVAKLDPLQWPNGCEEVFQGIKEVLGSLPTMQAPNWDKEFYVNSSVGEDAIRAMLLQQGTNSHYMKPIYCASRVKLEAKRDYTNVELIMMRVVYACRRLMKFIVELQEFQFFFLVEESTRSTLADLLTYKEAPLLVKEDTLKKQHMEAPDIDNAYLLFFDGSYRKSHNEASGGVVIYDPQAKLGVQDFEMGDAMKADGAFIGQDVSVRLHIQGYVDKEDFIISPFKHEDVILGAPCFDCLTASIKFRERKISFKFRKKDMS
ncbi:hypothetical protein L7F22_027768 [Adiantum nelumboides]|nr:hypothetical protein [Adiantum nelumboides]